MPDTNNELHQLLSDIQRALIQQKELTGDMLFVDPVAPIPQQEITAMAPHKRTPPVENGPDLFGLTPSPGVHLPAYPAEGWVSAVSLGDLNAAICNCVKCPLGQTRTKFVFGVGNPNADIVLVGEAPGADEDMQGEPFVGRAGQLLNKILEAVHFKREEVYICKSGARVNCSTRFLRRCTSNARKYTSVTFSSAGRQTIASRNPTKSMRVNLTSGNSWS